MPTVILLAGAENDTLSIFAKLEARSAVSADAFYHTLDAALQQLANHAESAPVFAGHIRRLVMHGYPFGIFYALENDRLFVHAVLDLRQNPEAIHRRLGDLS